MKVVIIDNGTKYLQSLVSLLKDYEVAVLPFEQINSKEMAGAGLVVLSGGGRVSFFDSPSAFISEIEFIRTTHMPLVGVCLGFELIVSAFGGMLKKLTSSEKGLLEIQVVGNDGIFTDNTHFTVYENHRVVARSVPPPLIALAESKDGIEAVKHTSLPIYAFQFHPEVFTDKSYGDEVFLRAIQNLCK